MGPIKFTIIKKLKSNNRFNYTPRYYKGKQGVEDTNQTTKFDSYADTYNENDYAGQWQNASVHNRTRNNTAFNKTVLIVLAALIYIFLYIIAFDLSIFSS